MSNITGMNHGAPSLCDRVHMCLPQSGSISSRQAGSCPCKPNIALTEVLEGPKLECTCVRAPLPYLRCSASEARA